MARARLPLVAGVAVLLALAAPAPADPGHGKGQGQAQAQAQGVPLVPKVHGHGAHAAPTAAPAAVPEAPASATGPTVTPPVTAPVKHHGNPHLAASGATAKAHGNPHLAASGATAKAHGNPHLTTSSVSVATHGNGRGQGNGYLKKAALAASQPVTPAVVTPPAAAPTPPPVAVTPSVPATARTRRVPTLRAHGRRGRTSRPQRAPRAGTRVATAFAGVQPVASAPPVPVASTTPAPAATGPKTTRATTNHPKHHAAPSSPIVRTVDRILEVVPGWVARALAAGAALALLLAGAALLQTLRARRLERDRRRLAADVGLLQAALLPPLPEQVGATRVSAAYRPADGLAAGGDFFDIFALPGGRTGLLLGDMAGHGREIVPFTALVRYSLRAYLEAGLEPRVALQVANHALEAQLCGNLVTAIAAVFDPATGALTYACAGHAPPLLAPTGLTAVTAASSPPIGTGHVTGRRQTTLALPPGTAACFCTDGVADVLTGDHRLGMSAVGERFAALGPQSRAQDLLDEIVRSSDGQPDDMAVCVLAPCSGASVGSGGVVEELELDAAMLEDGRVDRFLAGCGLTPSAAQAAHRSAAEMVAQRSSALLVVRRTAGEATARVHRPRTAVLPAARAAAREPQSAAAAG